MNHTTSNSISRREFVKQSAVGVAGLALGLAATSAAQTVTAKKIPVGVQLYSIRDQCEKDLKGTLETVGKIGYKGVEWFDYYGCSAKELRKMCEDNGLVTCGTHTPYEAVLPDKLKETIEFNKALGNKFIIVPWMVCKSAQEWRDRANFFNDIAPKVKAEGMYIGYHAHAHDFKKFDGVRAWDIFFGNTLPEVVMQLDTNNCVEGGANPVEVLKKYPGRAKTIHLKAHGSAKAVIGGGKKINWKEVFEFCEGPGGTEWYVVEYESGKIDMLKNSYEALKALGKV